MVCAAVMGVTKSSLLMGRGIFSPPPYAKWEKEQRKKKKRRAGGIFSNFLGSPCQVALLLLLQSLCCFFVFYGDPALLACFFTAPVTPGNGFY